MGKKMVLPTTDDAGTRARYAALAAALLAQFPDRFSQLDCGPGLGVVPFWVTAPTGAEQLAFAATVAGWDWTPRRIRADADLLAAVNALAAADRNKLLALAAVDLLQRRPGIARAFGLPVDGDS